MAKEFEIYCDESCHLNNKNINVMGFGGIRISAADKTKLKLQIAELKQKFNCNGELKWIKVSPKNIDYYKAIIDSFVETKGVEFHSVLIQNKSALNHEKYNNGSEDIFYYKMYFLLLKNIITRREDKDYRVFLDIKKKHDALEVNRLKQFLSTEICAEMNNDINNIQTLDSAKVSLLQLTDFFLGAVMYANRFDDRSSAKGQIVSYIEQKLNISLLKKSSYKQKRFHIFVFNPEVKDGSSK